MENAPARDALIRWATDSIAFYRLDLHRISTWFLRQAFELQQNREVAASDLTLPIMVLEGLSPFNATRPADKFRHPPLAGLYKKHFTCPRFLPKNIAQGLLGKRSGDRFDRIWDSTLASMDPSAPQAQFENRLAHNLVHGTLEEKRKAEDMTGEWIVFHKHCGLNYYLTVATHKEGDDNIYKRVAEACREDDFPFRL